MNTTTKNQHTRELISARKTSPKHSKKTRVAYGNSSGMRVQGTRYINSTRGTSSNIRSNKDLIELPTELKSHPEIRGRNPSSWALFYFDLLRALKCKTVARPGLPAGGTLISVLRPWCPTARADTVTTQLLKGEPNKRRSIEGNGVCVFFKVCTQQFFTRFFILFVKNRSLEVVKTWRECCHTLFAVCISDIMNKAKVSNTSRDNVFSVLRW